VVTSRQVVKKLAQVTGWPETDLRTRVRWLIEHQVLPKGKGGRSGAGAALLGQEHLASILLSMAAPEAKAAPDYCRRLAQFRAEDGQTILQAVLFGMNMREPEDGDLYLYQVRLPNLVGDWIGMATADWTVVGNETSLTTKQYLDMPSVKKKIRRARKGNDNARAQSKSGKLSGPPLLGLDLRIDSRLMIMLGLMLEQDKQSGAS
jgi:hypothetical protein